MEDRILKIAFEGGYELSTTEVLEVMNKINSSDPTDDDIYLWILVVCESDIDWASVRLDATLTDPALISLIENNNRII